MMKSFQSDVEFVAEQAVPLGKVDAGAVVQALADAKPDAIFNVLFAADLTRFVREGNTRGLFENMPVVSVLSGEPEYLEPLGADAPTGWIVTGYPWYAIDTPANKNFVEAYRKRYNETPKVGSVVGYASLMSIAQGLKAAGAVDTETRRRLRRAEGRYALRPDPVPQDRPSIHHGRVRGRDRGRGRQGHHEGLRLHGRRPPAAAGRASAQDASGPVMSGSGLLLQLLNGLADASALFLVAAGLSLIFGVTRVVNFAHGSFYMLGIYLAWTFTGYFGGGAGYWAGLLLAALATGLIGAAAERLVLSRLYGAPELFQLLATFALLLIIGDATLALWGPEDLFSARAPGLAGAVEILGRRYPQYDLLLIAAGPIVLGLLWLLLMRTRWGRLLRAASENRSMLAALGVNQAWLFTSAFTLGAFLAGLGGALAAPRTPATLGLDLEVIASAFVVVVVGGLGSIPGAFLAALLISLAKSLFVFLGQVQIGPWVFNLSS